MLAETGKPLFLHTWERAVAAGCFDGGIYIATDSDEIDAAARSAGAQVARTSAAAKTGSDRCAEALAKLPASVGYAVDIQGDWPEVEPADLQRLVDTLREGPSPTATLAVPMTDAALAADPNIVKVVRDRARRAMLFSRATIPHPREGAAAQAAPFLRHIGVYAFVREALLSIPDLPSSGLAEAESLEQLRFLENGIAMQVLDATGEPWGIESRPDYDAFLKRRTS